MVVKTDLKSKVVIQSCEVSYFESNSLKFGNITITPLDGGTGQAAQPQPQQGPMNTERTAKMKMPRNS